MEKLGLQGSVQWLMDRVGKVTASRFKDILGTAAKREAYLWEVVIERLTGDPTEHYASAAMAWGTEQEPFARMQYEAATGAIVEEVGFVLHPDLDGVGCSPDGLLGDDGGLEIKAPFNSANHLKTVLDGMPKEHAPQVQGSMWITGRKYWDFVSRDPRVPKPLDLHIQRIERDESYIASLAEEVAKFLADAETLLARLKPAANESAPQEVPESASLGPNVAAAATADVGLDPPAAADPEYITPDQCADLEAMCSEFGIQIAALKKAAKVERLALLKSADYARALAWVRKHKDAA